MSISNVHEKLLFFTKQKSLITNKMSNLQMQILSNTRNQLLKQQDYNAQLKSCADEYGFGSEEYNEFFVILNSEHEFEMASITAWESNLDAQKENLENQLNEITNYEKTYQTLLQQNIKRDFMYGQGK